MDKKKILVPGTIVFVDSNYAPQYDCFGVIIEEKFWLRAVEEERILNSEELGQYNSERYHLFRVLGSRSFRKYWQANNPEAIEPDEHSVMHYRFQGDHNVVPINLRPIIEQKNRLHGYNVYRLLCGNNDYILEALNEASIVYQYLDGKRFTPKKEYLDHEAKFLRLLEMAVPLSH